MDGTTSRDDVASLRGRSASCSRTSSCSPAPSGEHRLRQHGASDAEIEEAARLAKLHAVIAGLPEGWTR